MARWQDGKMARGIINGLSVVSGGVIAKENEIVVDDYRNPQSVYGVADGKGDFDRTVSKDQLEKISQKLLK